MISRQRKSILKKEASLPQRQSRTNDFRDKKPQPDGDLNMTSGQHKGQPPMLNPHNRVFWANVAGGRKTTHANEFSRIRRVNHRYSRERKLRRCTTNYKEPNMGSKKFLEDQYIKFEEEYGISDREGKSATRKKKTKVEWRCPIESERIITESEPGNLGRGYLSRMFSYLCIYLPSRVCPSESQKDRSHN